MIIKKLKSKRCVKLFVSPISFVHFNIGDVIIVLFWPLLAPLTEVNFQSVTFSNTNKQFNKAYTQEQFNTAYTQAI